MNTNKIKVTFIENLYLAVSLVGSLFYTCITVPFIILNTSTANPIIVEKRGIKAVKS